MVEQKPVKKDVPAVQAKKEVQVAPEGKTVETVQVAKREHDALVVFYQENQGRIHLDKAEYGLLMKKAELYDLQKEYNNQFEEQAARAVVIQQKTEELRKLLEEGKQSD